MSIIKKSPSKYVHSTGMLQQLDQYLQGMGKILLILISESWPRRIRACVGIIFCRYGLYRSV